MSDFHHGHEPRAEEIALHQKYLTLEGMMDAAKLEGDEREVRRLTPLVKRAKARWIKANRRVTREPRAELTVERAIRLAQDQHRSIHPSLRRRCSYRIRR